MKIKDILFSMKIWKQKQLGNIKYVLKICTVVNLFLLFSNTSLNVGTHILQSITVIAATLHKVKLLNNLAALYFNIWANDEESRF